MLMVLNEGRDEESLEGLRVGKIPQSDSVITLPQPFQSWQLENPAP